VNHPTQYIQATLPTTPPLAYLVLVRCRPSSASKLGYAVRGQGNTDEQENARKKHIPVFKLAIGNHKPEDAKGSDD
jgi:hypothetical protein